MSRYKEGHLSSAIGGFINVAERRPQVGQDIQFIMGNNGYMYSPLMQKWIFDADKVKPLADQFIGQDISFFGPAGAPHFFKPELFSKKSMSILQHSTVRDAIRKYRRVDEPQAARIAFILGGIIRHSLADTHTIADVAEKVQFTAAMTKLGGQRSGDAVASTVAMYVLSGSSTRERGNLSDGISRMAKSIDADPVVPCDTTDLGLSQLTRLRHFNGCEEPYKDLVQESEALKGFPTVGAEFHFPVKMASTQPNFWQRLAVLNMSQYQRGSYIQLSRNDRGVIEVRMNPSTYPVTVANWKQMKQIMPELSQSFFTLTLNRSGKNEDFAWGNDDDSKLLTSLTSLGRHIYAGHYGSVPPSERDEINFGASYLGQTVRMDRGKYGFTGFWNGGSGKNGQFGVYTGFGNNLPDLAYYLSMVLAKPDIVDPNKLNLVNSLGKALELPPEYRASLFQGINTRIAGDDRLLSASLAGERIFAKLGK